MFTEVYYRRASLIVNDFLYSSLVNDGKQEFMMESKILTWTNLMLSSFIISSNESVSVFGRLFEFD